MSNSAKQPTMKRSGSAGKSINIGLDYGTCSTKVTIRRRGETSAKVYLLDNQPTKGYPPFATPSAVRLSQDRVYFGRRAIMEEKGTYWKSLKVQLLPHEPDLGQTSSFAMPSGVDLDVLIASYFGWALGEIKQRLEGLTAENVSLNVAAPMSQIVDRKLKARYLCIVQAAWESAFGHEPLHVAQGSQVKTLQEYYAMWLKRDPPPISHRRYEVLPETIAPIVSLYQDPKMEPGMYLVVDMGAGTSEFSINQVTDNGADQKLNCYFDRSIRIGGDDIQAGDDGAVQTARSAALLKRLRQTFNETWLKGFQKDRVRVAREKWRKLRVILTGGGARHPAIDSLLWDARPDACFGVAAESYRIEWHAPTGLDLSAISCRIPKADLPLLSVAHGLSIERQRWPTAHNPDEIKTQEAPISMKPPAAYWYLDG